MPSGDGGVLGVVGCKEILCQKRSTVRVRPGTRMSTKFSSSLQSASPVTREDPMEKYKVAQLSSLGEGVEIKNFNPVVQRSGERSGRQNPNCPQQPLKKSILNSS